MVNRGQNVDGHCPVHAASLIVVSVRLQTSDVEAHVGAGQVGLAPVGGRAGGQVRPAAASTEVHHAGTQLGPLALHICVTRWRHLSPA